MPTLKTKNTKKKVKAPTKKVAKKVAKKAAVKKSTQKATESKKPLVYANGQTAFWVSNGQVLDSLLALRDALDEMEKEVYAYHAGNAQNDFANWVAAVLADNACATDLQKAKTPKSAKTTVVKHLKYYSV
ncbi:hypothetical protein H6785_00240 [Candidatus Nomurabacteria bacterium]|nr:hypothetical protein [Candidatus Nomurabacteria bacterium]